MTQASDEQVVFTIRLSGEEDGWVVAECQELPGCVSQGRTQLSALRNITSAICAVLQIKKVDAADRRSRTRSAEMIDLPANPEEKGLAASS